MTTIKPLVCSPGMLVLMTLRGRAGWMAMYLVSGRPSTRQGTVWRDDMNVRNGYHTHPADGVTASTLSDC